MTDVLRGEHVSPRCIEVVFDGPMRNNDDLRDPANYTVDIGFPAVTAVYVPTVQQAPYDPLDPNPNGGKPLSVYLLLDDDPYPVANPILVAVENIAPTSPVDYYAAAVLVANTTNADTSETQASDYWEDTGLRVDQAFREEMPKLGYPKFGDNQGMNRSMVLAIAKIADMMSGGSMSILDSAIVGPLETIDSFIPDGFVGGFGEPWPVEPGVGDSFAFKDARIPFHIDKLWGNCDGTNTLFRTSIPYHPFCCDVVLVPPSKYEHIGGDLDLVDWYSPNSGRERLIKLTSAPQEGYSVIAIYKPRQSLIRIGKEILAYHESDIYTGTATICGRSQLCTDLEEHAIGDVIEDVWCTSFVGRVKYNLLVFGASGRALEYASSELGLSRSDNPTFNDTELRRAVFNTGVTVRGTLPTAILAFRYVYPDLWPYVLIGEDPRWEKCLVVWYSSEQINFDTDIVPGVEPWETWLDHLAYSDGFPMDTYTNTYFRNPITDVSYDGDYFLAGPTSDDTDWPFPVVVSGPDIYLIGTPAPSLPEPGTIYELGQAPPMNPAIPTVNDKYRKYICRPYGLDRVLPAGTGVLLLDHAWAQ